MGEIVTKIQTACGPGTCCAKGCPLILW